MCVLYLCFTIVCTYQHLGWDDQRVGYIQCQITHGGRHNAAADNDEALLLVHNDTGALLAAARETIQATGHVKVDLDQAADQVLCRAEAVVQLDEVLGGGLEGFGWQGLSQISEIPQSSRVVSNGQSKAGPMSLYLNHSDQDGVCICNRVVHDRHTRAVWDGLHDLDECVEVGCFLVVD